MIETVSTSETFTIVCNGCSTSFDIQLYVVVDTIERPDLVSRIKDGLLHHGICPHCNLVMSFHPPLLVYRPDQPVRVIYLTAKNATQEQRDRQARILFHHLERGLGGGWSNSLTKGIYVVSDSDELAKVVDLDIDLITGRDPALIQALNRFLHSITWEEARIAVENDPVLLGAEAEHVMERGLRRMAADGEAELEAVQRAHLELVQACRTRGVEAAFAEYCDGSGRTRKRNLLSTMRSLAELSSGGAHPGQLIEVAREGLAAASRSRHEQDWIRLHTTIADSLLRLARRGKPPVTDDCTWHYRCALAASTRDPDDADWLLGSRLLFANRLTSGLPTAPQLILTALCFARPQDRRLEIVRQVWRAVWVAVYRDTPPPTLTSALDPLLGERLLTLAVQDEFEIPEWVVDTVTIGSTKFMRVLVNRELAIFHMSRISPETLTTSETDRAAGAAAIRLACQYREAAGDWEIAAGLLEDLLVLDFGPAAVAEAKAFLARAAAKAGKTHPGLQATLANTTGRGLSEVLPHLQSVERVHAASGDARAILMARLQLADALTSADRIAEALAVAESLPELAKAAGFGVWTQAATQVQLLEIQRRLDRDVLPQALRLWKSMKSAAIPSTTDPNETVVHHKVWEGICIVGARAAEQCQMWMESLNFSADHVASLASRSATAGELAGVYHDRYFVLMSLGELEAAETVLAHCRELYEVNGNPLDLASVCGALAEVKWAREERQAALGLQREAVAFAYAARHPLVPRTHRSMAQYLPATEAEAAMAHGLAAAVAFRTMVDESRSRLIIADITAIAGYRTLLDRVSLSWMAATLAEQGVELQALLQILGIEPQSFDAALTTVVDLLRAEEPSDEAWSETLVGRWEPATATLVAAVRGDRSAAVSLSRHLAARDLAPDWMATVAAFRAILDGSPGDVDLTSGLDAVDAAIVRRALDAVAGRVEPRATPADLHAVTDDALNRHRSFLEMVVGAAAGLRSNQDDFRAWSTSLVGGGLGHHQLVAAVDAVVAGNEPDTSRLTPSQAALISAVESAVKVGAPERSHAEDLYEALSDGMGPTTESVKAIVRNRGNLDEALVVICQGITTRVNMGNAAVAMRVAELAMSTLMSRGDFQRAVVIAETLAAIDDSQAIDAELAELVYATAVAQGLGMGPGSWASLVGRATPRRSIVEHREVRSDLPRRWLAAARAMMHLLPEPPVPSTLALAEARASWLIRDLDGTAERAEAALRMTASPNEVLLAICLLSAALRTMGRFSQAAEVMDRLPDAAPPSVELLHAQLFLERAVLRGQLGRFRAALGDSIRAVELLEPQTESGAQLVRANVLDQMGGLYERFGELAAAIAVYGEALETVRAVGYRSGEGRLLIALGSLFGKLSTGYLRPLSASENVEVAHSVLRIDRALFYAPTPQGSRAVARRLLEQAVGVFVETKENHGRLDAINALCNLIPDEQSEEAIVLLEEVLAGRDADPIGRAVTLANLANRLKSVGRVDEAVKALESSLDLSRSSGYVESAARTAGALGRHHLDHGDHVAAEKLFREAVALVEGGRRNRPANDRARVSITHQQAEIYAGLVACLLARDADEEAYHVVQLAKSRAMLELVATSNLQPTVVPEGRFSELLEQEARQLAILRQDYERTAAMGPAQDALDDIYDKMSSLDPDYVAMRRGTPATGAGTRAWLGRQGRPVLLVDFFIGLDRLSIFLHRAEWETVRVLQVSLDAGDLQRWHSDFQRQVVRYRNGVGSAWLQLSDLVMRPLGEFLEPDDLVVLVPHGILHDIPLHALTVGERPLIGAHPVVYVPASGLLPLCQSPAKGTGSVQTCAAFGVTYEQEAVAVAEIFGQRPVATGRVNPDQIEVGAAGQDVAHFSCHAYFSVSDPLGSGLLLGPGGPDLDDLDDDTDLLTAREIMRMRMRNELVTISGCQTGLQKALDGDELLGLSRAFLYAGTPSIVASLWPVDADATSDFMVRFYRHLRETYLRDGVIDKAAALRHAQNEIIDIRGVDASYYWAPFVLIGDWC